MDKKALIIVDNPTSLDDGEALLRTILESRGMIVTFADVTGPASKADGQQVVIAADSASPAEFNTVYGGLAVPMMAFGQPHMQGLGLVPAGSANRGNAQSTVQVTIVDAGTPLAGGLAAGTNIGVILPVRNTQIYWGMPGGTAIKIAAVMGAPTQLIVFAYEKGAMTALGTAAGRRVVLGWKTDAIKDLTVDAYKLMDSALNWTAGAP
jgi:hypothetical protein